MSQNEQAIRKLYRNQLHALNDGEFETLLSLYTEDAIQFPPDRRPLVGKEAIQSSLKEELGDRAFHAEIDIVELVVSGSLAFVQGRYSTEVKSHDDGAGTTTDGSFLDLLERQEDDTWKIARSSWSIYEPR